MKIDKFLLKDKDIENIQVRNSAYEIINKRIDEAIDNIKKEEFSKINQNEEELDRSYILMYKLTSIYKSYSDSSIVLLLLFSVLGFSSMLYTACFDTATIFKNSDSIFLHSFIFIISIIIFIWSNRILIIRQKIRNNLKKYNLLDSL